jgi:imidazolonepropionase-like amidohydrolase
MKDYRFVAVLVVAIAGLTTPFRWPVASAQGRSSSATLAVVGGFLIDGHGGPPRRDAVVLIDGETITSVGSEGRLAVPVGARVIDANGYTVMPGLIDAHVHLDLLGHALYDTWHPLVRDEYADVMRIAAAQLLAHGVTTARDAGGALQASVETRDRVARGEIPGPRLLVSGDMLVNWPESRWRTWYRGHISMNVHTNDDARQATIRLIEGGADAIKIRGGLTREQIRAVTTEARARGKLVGAHVYTDEEIQDAVLGGVDLLDHAGSAHQTPLFSAATLRLLAERRIPVAQSIAHRVTLYPAHLAWPERLDDPALSRELGRYAELVLRSLVDFPTLGYFSDMLQNLRIAPEAGRQLHGSGGLVIVGTDSGTPGYFHSEAVWREVEALVSLAGMTTAEAIKAATKDAAAALRVNAGVVEPGRLADLILVRGNPLDDVRVLQRVEHVIKGGVEYK